MMDSSFTIIRIRGIPVGAHWTWLFVFALVVWSLATALFPESYPGLSQITYAAMGIAASLLFFASILLHEIGHAWQALKEGMRIHGITLWLLGGVARFSGMFPSPGAEFRIAIAGPLVSIGLALVFWLVTAAGNAVGLPDAAVGVADYLARINAIVVAFNLVPALPLDGGRVLRAWLWRRQGSFSAATTSAARAGTAFGGLLVAIGLLDFFTGAGGASGLWLVFLGWFLIQASQSEAAAGGLHDVVRDRRVRDFMTPDPVTVAAGTSIDEFLEGAVHGRGHSSYPVVAGDRLVGLISLKRAGAVVHDERPYRRVDDVMWPAGDIAVFPSDTEMSDVLDSLDREPRRAPVVDEGRVVGILSVSDVMHALELERLRRPKKPTRRAGVAVWVVVGVVMLAAVAYLYNPPLATLRPGETLDVSADITITGVPTDEVDGSYLLTSVRLDQPNGLEALFFAITNRAQLVPLSQVFPEGVDQQQYFRQQREIFKQSQTLAAAAAANMAGLDVSISGKGVRVDDLLPGSPAASVLDPGDVIVAVGEQPVRIASDLQEAIASRPPGTRFNLTIERDGERREVEIRSARLEQIAEGGVGIGVIVSTRDFDVDLPFDIEFRNRNIGGPSAGLAYALAITDLLDERNIAEGRTIGATGTVDTEGEVGPVGGVNPKAIALEDAGADTFLVPEREVDLVTIQGLEVQGVTGLGDALRALGVRGSS
jgi:PDZ domain-containing secreted protein/Zn-dependent protease/CBS domain-containing protein